MTQFNNSIYSGISCNLDQNILATALPLFEEGSVEAIEWSFDALFRHSKMPFWFKELLQLFGNEGRLIGHGVYFSLFSGKLSAEQINWLNKLKSTAKQFKFDHITEHFGFMTGEDFHKGAPLSVPLNEESLKVAKDRIARMYLAANCPIGLENLAFSYSKEDVLKQGEFLAEILKNINGFIILDLHNLFCQSYNFNILFSDLIKLYPLHLVREIHLSGGSWEKSEVNPRREIRRDTHNDRVPEEVFNYLKEVLRLVPNLKFVILEQMGTALKSAESQEGFRADFKKMKRIVQDYSTNTHGVRTINNFLPSVSPNCSSVVESSLLAQQQKELSDLLEKSKNLPELKVSLTRSSLINSDWNIENWEDEMLETAFAISQKWKHGF